MDLNASNRLMKHTEFLLMIFQVQDIQNYLLIWSQLDLLKELLSSHLKGKMWIDWQHRIHQSWKVISLKFIKLKQGNNNNISLKMLALYNQNFCLVWLPALLGKSLNNQTLNLLANFCKIKIEFSRLLRVVIIKLSKRE